ALHLHALRIHFENAARDRLTDTRQGLRGPDAQALAAKPRFRDRPGIEGPDLALENHGRAVPVEHRFSLVQLVRVDDAVFALRDGRRQAALEQTREALAEHFGTEDSETVVQAAAGFLRADRRAPFQQDRAGVQAGF